MLIRSASKSDFDNIWSIFQVVIEPGDTYVFASDTSRDDVFEYWFGTGVKTFVVEDGEQIVGMYKLVANQRDLGSHVANASFMVNPRFQGQGIGKLMGLHCIEEAKKASYLAIQFNFVVSTNKPAVALWEKLGFSIVGTLPKAFKHKDLGYVNAYVMYRSLE